MTYTQNVSLLETSIVHGGTGYAFHRFFSKSGRVRTDRGEHFWTQEKSRHHHHRLFYEAHQEDTNGKKFIRGEIKDRLLLERILTYLNELKESSRNNCSAFANFLFTGEFVESGYEKDGLVLKTPMSIYSGQKIELGDMVFIIYFDKRLSQRGGNPQNRKSFLRSKRMSKNSENIFDICRLEETQTINPKRLKEILFDSFFYTFHFMICIGEHNGEPVFISQAGRNWNIPPGETPSIVITIGGHDVYGRQIPGLILIKKR